MDMDSATLYSILMNTGGGAAAAPTPTFLGLSAAAYKQILLISLPPALMAVVYMGMRRNAEADSYRPAAGAAYNVMEAQWRENKEAATRMSVFYPLFALIVSGLAALFSESWIWGAATLSAFAAWHVAAYYFHAGLIGHMAKSRPVERHENQRVYNLLGNLCMACGVRKTPRLRVIADEALNAFSSGMKGSGYTVTLTTGLINKLSDEELSGVLAHELAHIRNGDARISTLSLIFNSVYKAPPIALRRALRPLLRDSKDGVAALALAGIVAVFWVPALLINSAAALMRFAASQKREFIADAEGTRLTGKPWALANALKKIHGNCRVDGIDNEDLAGMFISGPREETGPNRGKNDGVWTDKLLSLDALTPARPDIRLRIRVLEQFDERTDATYKTRTTVFK